MKTFEYVCGICGGDVKLTVYVPLFKGQTFNHCPSCFILYTCPKQQRHHELSELVKQLRANKSAKEQALLFKRAIYMRRMLKVS